MIISLKEGADTARVTAELAARGLWVSHVERAEDGRAAHVVIAPYSAAAQAAELRSLEGVADVSDTAPAAPLVAAQGPVVRVGGHAVGGGAATVMAGPCSVESEAQISEIASALAELGVRFLRGGAFKPRTSPYSFQGHGAIALGWLRRAADKADMAVVTEALSEADADVVAEHADLVQIGSRNMQNYALLRAVGKTGKPVLLKRGMAATVDEWLLSGEYLLGSGSAGVVFCERGVRGFDPSTRNLVDLGAVALLAHVHKLPVVVDPSHALGRRDLVVPIARAAIAAGAAGVMVETHADPGQAKSDGPQALELAKMGEVLRALGGGAA